MLIEETRGQQALRDACVPPPPRMSAKELARRLKVTRQAISMWVRGTRKPNPIQRKKLKKLLGIDESYWDLIAEPFKQAA